MNPLSSLFVVVIDSRLKWFVSSYISWLKKFKFICGDSLWPEFKIPPERIYVCFCQEPGDCESRSVVTWIFSFYFAHRGSVTPIPKALGVLSSWGRFLPFSKLPSLCPASGMLGDPLWEGRPPALFSGRFCIGQANSSACRVPVGDPPPQQTRGPVRFPPSADAQACILASKLSSSVTLG